MSHLPPPPQRCIINNTHRLVELCVSKLSQDWFPLLELLAMAVNPHCKFHIYNGTRPSETVPAGVQLAEDELFARPPDPRSPKVSRTPSRTPDIFSNLTAEGVVAMGYARLCVLRTAAHLNSACVQIGCCKVEFLPCVAVLHKDTRLQGHSDLLDVH